ncbi:MAG TPA: hypothetical protein VF921_15395 [Vicinamibacterales bacterium]
MKLLIPIAVVICVFLADVAQRPNMRIRAAQNGGSAEDVVTGNTPAAPLSVIINECDLALHGRILSVTPHLTADASSVVTDYKVVPLGILKQNRRIDAARPSPAPPIIVQRLGGAVNDGGLRLSTNVDGWSFDEDLKSGEEVVMFLGYRAEGGTYHFMYGPFGTFRVIAGQVHTLTREAAARRGDRPESLVDFLGQVETRLKNVQ